MRRYLAVTAACLLLAGCGTKSPESSPRPEAHPAAPTSAPTSGPDQAAAAALASYTTGEVPQFSWGDKLFHFVAEDGSIVDRAPWTACLSNGCWDGAPTLGGPVHSVGSPDALYFAFDYPGWTFHDVSFNPVDETCHQRVITVRATQVSDQVFRIDPAGAPGPWRVDVFGRGPQGDAVASVLWNTPSPGTRGAPAAGISAVLAAHDGRLDSYGVELSLSRLDRSYPDATAALTVTSASGRSVTMHPDSSSRGCGREGTVYFTAGEEVGRRATRIGDGPFTYTAKVHLGPTTYVGTGTYPDDLIKGNEPSIRLTWDPPLPSYAD